MSFASSEDFIRVFFFRIRVLSKAFRVSPLLSSFGDSGSRSTSANGKMNRRSRTMASLFCKRMVWNGWKNCCRFSLSFQKAWMLTMDSSKYCRSASSYLSSPESSDASSDGFFDSGFGPNSSQMSHAEVLECSLTNRATRCCLVSTASSWRSVAKIFRSRLKFCSKRSRTIFEAASKHNG